LVRNLAGQLEPASWDEAVGQTAAAFRATARESGPDAVGVFGGGSLTNEKAYLLGKFARVALGTSQIGTATGMVGALGGVGGFLLPLLLGGVHQGTGSFAPGFLVLALAATTAFGLLRLLVATRQGWAASWRVRAAARSAPAPADSPVSAAVPVQKFSR